MVIIDINRFVQVINHGSRLWESRLFATDPRLHRKRGTLL